MSELDGRTPRSFPSLSGIPIVRKHLRFESYWHMATAGHAWNQSTSTQINPPQTAEGPHTPAGPLDYSAIKLAGSASRFARSPNAPYALAWVRAS